MKYYTSSFSTSDGLYSEESWGYKTLKSEGKPVTSYHKSKSYRPKPGSGVTGLIPYSHPLYAGLYNKARTRVLESIDSKALMTANAVELKGTFDLISQTASSFGSACVEMSRALVALKRGYPGAASQHFKAAKKHMGVTNLHQFNNTLAGTVLAVNWALKPVTQDVTQALRQAVEKRTGWYSFRTSASGHKTTKTDYGSVLGFYEDDISVRFGGKYTISNDVLRKLHQTGLDDPLGTLWELTPFSFVVDWFVNVGDHVAALSDWNGLSFKDTYTVVFGRRVENKYSKPGYGTYWSTTGKFEVIDRSPSFPSVPKWTYGPPIGGPMRTLNQLAFAITQSKSIRSEIHNL